MNGIVLAVIVARTIQKILGHPALALNTVIEAAQISIIFAAVIAYIIGKPAVLRKHTAIFIFGNIMLAISAIAWFLYPSVGEGSQLAINLAVSLGVCSLFILNALAVAKISKNENS